MRVSQVCEQSNSGIVADDRRTRAFKSCLCNSKNRGHRNVPSISQAVWMQLHRSDAYEPLRAETQLRPGEQPRPAGYDSANARSKNRGAAFGYALGNWPTDP